MSKRKYEDLKEILCHELNEITRKGEMDREALDNVYKLTSSLTMIKKLMKEDSDDEEDEEYSQNYGGASNRMNPMMWSNANRRGYSRASNGMYSEENMSNDYSQARGRNSQTGRYMSRDGGSYESYDRGYSRHDAEEKVVQKLEDILATTQDDHIRKAIIKAMDIIND